MIVTIFLISLITLIIFITFRNWAKEAGEIHRYSSTKEEKQWIEKHPFKEKLYRADFDDETGLWGIIIPAIILGVSIIFGIGIACSYSEVIVIDDKIAMYEEENTKIEERINGAVSEYMNYEQSTFSLLKAEGIDVVFAMYPELKSNDLVMSQMNLYTENSKKIKELKERKFDLRLMRWGLIFF